MRYLSGALLLLWALPAVASDVLVRVVDSHEAVIAGASVEIRGSEGISRHRTDARGTSLVAIQVPAHLRVTAPGFAPFDLQWTTPPQESVTVRLLPAPIHTTIEVVVKEEQGPSLHERTAVEIERGGARTVYDAIDRLFPGIHVTRRGAMGYGLNSPSGAVSIRGIGGTPNTQVLIVVDGRPDFMGLMGHPIPDFYSLSDVGSLAITQGPASVLYGSGAMGGVIEIQPRPAAEGAYTELTTGFGSFATGQYRLSHGNRIGKGDYRLTAGINHTSGDRDNSAFRSQDGTVGLGYPLSSRWKASLQGRYGHFGVEDPGTVAAPVSGQFADVGRGGFNLGLDNAGERTWGSTTFFASYGHHRLWDGFRSTDTAKSLRHVQSFAVTPKLTVDAGMDLSRYGGAARNIKSVLNYGEHRISDSAGFSRASYLVSEALTLNAGFRVVHNSVFGTIAVPEFGALYRFSTRYAFSAAIGEGYRNPTVRELYLFPAPNPSLKPERLWNFQGTFHVRPARSLAAWVTGYYAEIRDLIVTLGRYPALETHNHGSAINKGVEVNARWQPARRISISGGYANLHSTNLAPYVPENKLTFSLDFDAGKAFVSLSGAVVGRRWADRGKVQELDPYELMTLNLSVPLGPRMRAFAIIDNLLNRRYEVVAGYPMPRINAGGGIKFLF